MKFTLGRKVWGLSLTVFVLTGIASLCVYWHMSDALAWQKMVVDVKWPAAQIFSDALSSMNMMRSVVREAVLDRDDPASFAHHVEVYKENREVLDSAISRLETMAKGFQKEENKERVRVISANYREMIAGQDRAFEQAKAGDVKGAAATLRTIVPKGAMVRLKMKELQEQNNTLTGKIFVDMQSDMHAAVNWLLICFAIVVAIGSAISWRVARQVSGDAEMLCRRAQLIASGHLDSEPLVSTSEDEFRELAESMNQMQSQLQQVIYRIASTARELGEAGEQISSVSTHTAASSREQTDQTNLVATAIHEMASTVREVSDHSRSASDAAEDASRTARQGGSLVDETRDVMTRIAESNQKVSERVTKLGESSQQVAKIAAVIDDIADQTNLLALNAAIEAARAGEQGRGFAVVADEVRKLAERTTAATREIAGILQVILSESQSTAAAIDESREDVQNGLARAGKAGEALSQIIGVATRVGDMVSQIATAATEQSSATEEIQGSAERIAGMARETAKAADESASACAQLTGLASSLQEMVSHFRLHESATESSRLIAVRHREGEWKGSAALHATRRNLGEYSDRVN